MTTKNSTLKALSIKATKGMDVNRTYYPGVVLITLYKSPFGDSGRADQDLEKIKMVIDGKVKYKISSDVAWFNITLLSE